MDYRAYFYDSADVLTTFIGKSQPELEKIVVASRDEYEKIMQAKRSVTDVNLKEAEEVSF